jgi:hypothetical protein
MGYRFCGYFVSYNTLKKLMPSDDKIPVTSGLRPYVRQMAEMVNTPANRLDVTWDEMFRDARPVEVPGRSTDEDDNVGVLLVRVEGDLAEGPELFRETNGDRLVKALVEERLGVDLGPFLTMLYTL